MDAEKKNGARVIKKVVIHIRNHKIIGEIATHEGYRGRLSDVMNEEKRFININDAEMFSLVDDKPVYKVAFLCLNKDAIILVHPLE